MSSILVFDSGIGGISVAKAIQARLPGLGIHYFCDNAFLPYGDKTAGQLLQRVPELLQQAYDQLQPQLVVIACNTASTVLLPALRERLPCEVVGVVPAIKPACLKSKNKQIALLATAATLEREYTQQLIEDFAVECEVHRVNASELVHTAELYLQQGHAALPDSVKDHPALNDPSIDTAVLGCTHFPLLLPLLKRQFPHINHWVDSGDAIARRVEDLLKASDSDTNPKAPPGLFISSAPHDYPAKTLLPLQFANCEMQT